MNPNFRKCCIAVCGLGVVCLATGCAGQSPADSAKADAVRRLQPAQPVVSSAQAAAGLPVVEKEQDIVADARSTGSVVKVSIDNFTFHPETLEIPAGTTVIWVNADDVPHTVRSTEDLFRSGTLDTDDVYERKFDEPGAFEYYCGVHRHMTGKVIVK